ncbi:hypothetical protein Pelo_9415 [Pelomyxa schiedti]|nr:hypothetical protein Pelo_9415 [Pelomyxa schiedti]
MGQTHPKQQTHPTQQPQQQQPQVIHHTTPTTTTAKSQLIALLSAPVVASRPKQPSTPTPTPSTTEPDAAATTVTTTTTTTTSATPAPSFITWARSTALVAEWARGWVLAPTTNAVLDLPGVRRFLHVCVSSATLGLVSSHRFGDSWGDVRGCVGDRRVLARRWEDTGLYCGYGRHYCVVDVVGGPENHVVDVPMTGDNPPSHMCSNRKWIVGVYGWREVCVWKVVGSGCDDVVKVSEEHRLSGIDAEIVRLQFSPLSEDCVIAFTYAKFTANGWIPAIRKCVYFIDLEASFKGGNAVIKSTVEHRNRAIGLVWMPDGSTCTLHEDLSSGFLLRETTTGNTIRTFQQHSTVIPVGAHHILVVPHNPEFSEFQVYSTSKLTAPLLCVPCKWACTSFQSVQSGLIASTLDKLCTDTLAKSISHKQFPSTVKTKMGQSHPVQLQPQQQNQQQQPQVIHHTTPTTTTAKSQLIALLSAPVVASRPKPPSTPTPTPSTTKPNATATTTTTTTTTTSATPAPSFITWARSTALVAAWARGWVLWPTTNAVFELPGARRFLHVGVSSATLGLVASRWLETDAWAEVRGCVGDRGGVLGRRWENDGIGYPGYGKHHSVADGGGSEIFDLPMTGNSPCLNMCSNRKWIVGVYGWLDVCVWKVVGSGCDGVVKVSEEHHLSGIDAAVVRLQFSPLSEDCVMAFTSAKFTATGWIPASRERVYFIDLEASFKGGNAVIKSTVEHSNRAIGMVWMPDGSTCILHEDLSSGFLLRETTTGNTIHTFQQHSTVIPVGAHHILVVPRNPECSEFQVYSTSKLTAPLLCVPCTWACTSFQSVQSGLIASTLDKKSTNIQFTVHDCVTGFCVGSF